MTRPLALALALLAAGCSDPVQDGPAEVATFEETDLSGDDVADSVTTRAVFVAATLGGDAALFVHEEISSEMPAMRMQFALERPDLIAGLVEGDKVELGLVERSSQTGYVVTDVTPLSPDIELDLDGIADSAAGTGTE